jgi:DtxR family Mn-dependent transcriptional regulator
MEDVWKQFEENDITHSAAHHLLAIMDLRAKRGYARVTDVAKELNITTGSASTNLKSLKQKGFIVEDDNKFLILSSEGERLAKAIVVRNELVKEFFEKVLRVSPGQAEIDACKIEHLVSAETTAKLEKFLKEFKKI